ncbi:HupE/UreJ family protein [Vibrio algarum]|uniref:HupE/UreJ family protein n=1 Tax=Vibrio algarum TaxID=3020714 RepID=A0ABT4YRC1_9VIBR|nr:HupE/UreJ family protein [Vibrio sp. KJ40-1]MDB1124099.1 HupE/UreJ family protein [Vibrio sp. KJ40-1]
MKKTVGYVLVLLSSMVISTSCLAHSIHSGQHISSFSEGFLHPLTGLDHIAALILVGVFAAISGKKVASKLLLLVSAALLVGFMAGTSWAQASQVESIVFVSLVLLPLSLMAYRKKGMMNYLATAAIALFSASHGLVQGAEARGTLIQYGIGTMLASMIVIALTVSVTKLVIMTADSIRLAR